MLKEVLGIREGILADLHNDHEEVSAMIEQISASQDNKERGALFKELMEKFFAHSKAEADILYKKLEKSDSEESRKFALEGGVEHHVVENHFQEMARSRNKESDKWTAQLTVLKELIQHHVKEEESTGFSNAHSQFDREQLVKMGEQFQREKERLLSGAA